MMRVFILVLLWTSCVGRKSAEERLNQYLDLRLSGNHGREEIMDFLTGEMRDDISNMSDEEFGMFSALQIKKVKDINIIKKNCKTEVCFLTYTFKYSRSVFDANPQTDRDVDVEVKKVAKLEVDEEKWKISAIDNTKSFVRFNKPIDIYN